MVDKMARRDEDDDANENNDNGNDLNALNVRAKRPEEHIPAWLAFCIMILYYAIRVSVYLIFIAIEIYARYRRRLQSQSVEKVTALALIPETGDTVSETVSQPAEEEDTDISDPGYVHPLEIKDSVATSDSTTENQPVKTTESAISDSTSVQPLGITEVAKNDQPQEGMPVSPEVTSTTEDADDHAPADECSYSTVPYPDRKGSSPSPVKGPPDKTIDQNTCQESQQHTSETKQETMEELGDKSEEEDTDILDPGYVHPLEIKDSVATSDSTTENQPVETTESAISDSTSVQPLGITEVAKNDPPQEGMPVSPEVTSTTEDADDHALADECSYSTVPYPDRKGSSPSPVKGPPDKTIDQNTCQESQQQTSEPKQETMEEIGDKSEEEDTDISDPGYVHPLEIKDSVATSDSTTKNQPVETTESAISDSTSVQPLGITEVAKNDPPQEGMPVSPEVTSTTEDADDHALADECSYSTVPYPDRKGSSPSPVKGPPDKTIDQNTCQESQQQTSEPKQETMEEIGDKSEEEDTDISDPGYVHPLEIKDSVATSDSTTKNQPVETTESAISDSTSVQPLGITEVAKNDPPQEGMPVSPEVTSTTEDADDHALADECSYSTVPYPDRKGSSPSPVKGPPDKTIDQNTCQESQQQTSDPKQETMEELEGDECTVASSKLKKDEKSTSASKSNRSPTKLLPAENKLVTTYNQTEGNDPAEQPSLANESQHGQTSGIQEMEQADGYEDTGGRATSSDRDQGRDSPGMVAGVQITDISLGAPNESSESAPGRRSSMDSNNGHSRELLVSTGQTKL